ncbi:DUF3696 domain-containing protein [Shewanella fodinae]|jgi:hypothetical protein|uniref:DUF3696 domain-containing protein n=1 Tax=Shewanella fodinae TaxID=552357 RepID=UPI001678374D|nr:DUF3696 domain-containing protein [Shewanella fodinae]MCL2908239.1 DUF3696 domain-containing protein [Shewanella fodinae]GGZ14494.1 hypothetical protein GCM10007169_33700 [Shewanella fodinae]
MRITQLGLTNFRAFKTTQTLNFAPLTLLFGANSVGKSSVLLALFYLQEILTQGDCSPKRIKALGSKYVGGFSSLVHGKALDNAIVLNVRYDKPTSESGSSYQQTAQFIEELLGQRHASQSAYLTISSPSEWANSVNIELEIRWHASSQSAYVARYSVWADDLFIAEAVSDEPQQHAVVHLINYQHPLLLSDTETANNVSHGQVFQQWLLEAGTSTPQTVSCPYTHHEYQHTLFEFESRCGALPKLGAALSTSLEADSPLNTARLNEVLSDLFVAPLDNLAKLLNDSLSIGPLRRIPDRYYGSDDYIQQMDWYSGEASWDAIQHADDRLISECNHWLGDEHLALGMALVKKHPSDQERFSLNGQPLAAPSLPSTDKVVLWDVHHHIEVTPADVGAGVAQIFPLVIAATQPRKGMVCCEQPELHVHPKVQVAIGDLLTQCQAGNQFLIETHSEHLVLRLLRRIRESEQQQLPSGYTPLTPADISLLYLESSDEGTQVINTQITDDGDLANDWPNGFFEERDEELF